MRQRLAGMSPRWGVKKGAMGYARGAPLKRDFMRTTLNIEDELLQQGSKVNRH